MLLTLENEDSLLPPPGPNRQGGLNFLDATKALSTCTTTLEHFAVSQAVQGMGAHPSVRG